MLDEEDIQYLFDLAYAHSTTLYATDSATWMEVCDKLDAMLAKHEGRHGIF